VEDKKKRETGRSSAGITRVTESLGEKGCQDAAATARQIRKMIEPESKPPNPAIQPEGETD